MTIRGLPHSEISGSSLVGSSPKLIAACYVLHRLSCQGIHLCALKYLLTKTRSRNTLIEIAVHTLRVDPPSCLAHESSSLCSFQGTRDTSSVPSKLNSAVPTNAPMNGTIVLRETLEVRAAQPRLKSLGLVDLIRTLAVYGRANPDLRASSVVDRMSVVAITLGAIQRHGLLRKEVIQPHLPIRLPCYDFVPLT